MTKNSYKQLWNFSIIVQNLSRGAVMKVVMSIAGSDCSGVKWDDFFGLEETYV